MIQLIPIKVECYSGDKADEYPKCFYWNNSKYEIREIIDHWYKGEANPDYPVANYYKIILMNNRQYIIKHIFENDVWCLCLEYFDWR